MKKQIMWGLQIKRDGQIFWASLLKPRKVKLTKSLLLWEDAHGNFIGSPIFDKLVRVEVTPVTRKK